jgi:flagellar motor protein MotB
MKKALFPLLVTIFLVGCQQKQEDQAAHDAKVAQQAREALLRELKAKEEAERKAQAAEGRLSYVGVTTTPDGKIIIDTNKTKSYFETVARKMKEKVDQLAKDIQKGVIEEKEAGIVVSEERIVIDVNKTKGFMEQWAKKMEGFVKEMGQVAKAIETDMNVSTQP